MKLRSVFALTISLGLCDSGFAFGQSQDKQKSPQVVASPSRGQPTVNPNNWSYSSSMFLSAPNQPGNDQWSTIHPYLGAWSSEDMRTSGVTLSPADDALRAHLKLPSNQGLVVTGLNPHSSAGQSGIQLNDVLLTLGDMPLGKTEDLEKHLKSVGEKPVTLQLLRAGKETKVQIQPQIQVTFRAVPANPPEKPYWIGISISALDPALRAQLQLPDRQGLIVNEVVKDSPAAKAEIKVNDILFEIDGKPMSDSAKLVDIVQSHADKPMVLHFIREGKKHWSVEVTPERRKTAGANSSAERMYRMMIGRPGAVVTDTVDVKSPNPSKFLFYNHANDTITLTPNDPTAPKQPADASAGVSKRLDALDASIKQLRQAIEELSRATKAKK